MVPNNIRIMRMAKEMLDLTRNPPHGITCWAKNDRNDQLEAIIQGSKDTPYEGGSFRIDIAIPERYPMDPPQLKFLTKIYHPNIDNSTGLICLDVLKMPPLGRWRPVNNISLILTAVQQLLMDPNPHDPLDASVAQEYISNKTLFLENAKKWTLLYAKDNMNSVRTCKRKSPDEEYDYEKAKYTPSPSVPLTACHTTGKSCVDELSTTKIVKSPYELASGIPSKRKKSERAIEEGLECSNLLSNIPLENNAKTGEKPIYKVKKSVKRPGFFGISL